MCALSDRQIQFWLVWCYGPCLCQCHRLYGLVTYPHELSESCRSMVNSIVGGQVIETLSNGKCPLVVGVILIALVSLIIALLGYKFVHYFERFSWMIMIILFCIVAGLGAKHFYNAPMGSGTPEAASVLSFGGAIFGFSVAWISLTADYNVNMKEDIPRWKVFFWTYLGLFLSLNLIEMLGMFTWLIQVDK
jgi:purine-cytosine permease-like protein